MIGRHANLTLSDVAALPPTVDPETAFRVLGIGRTKGHEMLRAGTWPTRVLRIGNRYRIPTAELRALVGMTTGGEPKGAA